MNTIKLTDFGKAVRKLRIDADKTLGDMAKAISKSPGYLSSVEVGRKPVTDELIENTCEYFTKLIGNFNAADVYSAADRTRDSVNVGDLDAHKRAQVAAFARKLSENNLPDNLDELLGIKLGGNK